MKGLDWSIIQHVRIPHEQFVAIEKKAEVLLVEDKDKGGCIRFNRAKEKEVDVEEMHKRLNEILEKWSMVKEEVEDNN